MKSEKYFLYSNHFLHQNSIFVKNFTFKNVANFYFLFLLI